MPAIARSPPRSCPSPDEAVAEIRDALGSIGDTSVQRLTIVSEIVR